MSERIKITQVKVGLGYIRFSNMFTKWYRANLSQGTRARPSRRKMDRANDAKEYGRRVLTRYGRLKKAVFG